MELLYAQFVAQKESEVMLCDSLICKQVLFDAKKLAPHQFKFHISQHKRKLERKRQQDIKKKIYTKKIMQKEGAEDRAIRAEVLKSRPRYSKDKVYTLNLPSGYTTMARPDREKYDTYVAKLSAMIDLAFNVDLDEEESDEWGQPAVASKQEQESTDSSTLFETINGRICGICKGGCCSNGGNHAFLEVPSLVRVRRQHPDWTPGDMLYAYVSRIGEKSIENGCINQTDTGCALPRDLRADLCNAFFCNAVRNFNEYMERKGSLKPTLVIQRSNTNWNAFDPDFENEVLNVVLIDGDDQEEIDFSEIELPDS